MVAQQRGADDASDVPPCELIEPLRHWIRGSEIVVPLTPQVMTAQKATTWGRGKALAWAAGTTFMLIGSGSVTAQSCGPLPAGGYGPYDYRTQRDKAAIVEQYHFTPRVEALLGGATGKIGSDLEYVLERIPNHHRALLALFRLADRYPSGHVNAMQYPVDCYFERALEFRRDDSVVRTLFALYLGKTKRKPDAMRQLDLIAEQAGENAFTHNSLGAAYADLEEWDKAAAQAQRAMELGLTKSELLDRLKAKGKWPPPDNGVQATDLPPAAAASAASSTPASSPASTAVANEARGARATSGAPSAPSR